MKTKYLMKCLLVACVLWGCAPVVQAFYNPSSGQWLSRDPIGEWGGVNVYSPLLNRPVDLFDPLGLEPYQTARSIVNIRGGRKPNDTPTPTPTPQPA